ncbi:hypothetical protein [Clostridium hydrogenum]|uniref:hypothetical protein n=1 Tax=Clostridium hydrogenum TaxID=2855764 RepID=UPI001F2B69D3|nr:hypothetical protein [Clostridium hydrogenum]
MGLMGSLIKVTGKVAGKAAEYSIKATGGVVSIIADANGNKELAEKAIKVSGEVGEFVGETTKVVGNGLGFAMDKAIEVASAAGGSVGGYIAEAAGADEKQIQKAKVIGSVVGGGAVGLVTGDIIGSTVTGIAAAHGVASTGTAISALHGAAFTNATVASVGGGALSAGGGGIAAGQAILHGIDIAATAGGSIDAVANKNSISKKELQSDKTENISAQYEVLD